MTNVLAEQLAVLGVLMFIGWIYAKKGSLNRQVSKGLSDILIDIATPAIILASYMVDYDPNMSKLMGKSFFYSVIILMAAIFVSRIATHKVAPAQRKILQFGLVFSNSGYMGLPLIKFVFGDAFVIYASIYMIAANALTWTYGDGLMSGKPMEDKKELLKKVLQNPALIAVFIGLIIFFGKIPLPKLILQPIHLLSGLSAPLSMFVLGQKCAEIKWNNLLQDRTLHYGLLLRLFLMPLSTIVLLKLLQIPEDIAPLLFLMQALPNAVVTVILAERYELDEDFASKLTILSHMMCLFTIPLLARLL